jgi:hypothetical protein
MAFTGDAFESDAIGDRDRMASIRQNAGVS